MGNRGYPPPKHLAAKLLAIRKSLGLTQVGVAKLLVGPESYRQFCARISEFEKGRRQPSVLMLLAYARAANIPLENIVDDEIELKF